MNFRWIVIVLISFFFASCKKDNASNPNGNNPTDTMVTLTPYIINTPTHFPELIIPIDNQPFVERIKLGRMLYYDEILSNDGRACASCHLQSKGFTVDGMVNGMPVLPHVNLGWNKNFMWDGAEQGTLEDVMRFEVKDFFGTDLTKINNNKNYRSLFKQYYGVDEITYKELSYALAQFVRTMISRDTKYDQFINGLATLTYDEMQGRNLFFSEKGDCYHCHVNPVLTDNLFHNIGLDSIYTKNIDKGRFIITGSNTDLGKFRTPNLRNVALRKKYMHDGRFNSLEEVVAFYNNGVRKVNNLDPIMTKPGKEYGLKLTSQEQMQLVSFLKTFTDDSFINDTTLSHP